MLKIILYLFLTVSIYVVLFYLVLYVKLNYEAPVVSKTEKLENLKLKEALEKFKEPKNPIHRMCVNMTKKPIKEKIDPRMLRFVETPKNCCESGDIDLLAYVFSKVESFGIRNKIRQTWANKNISNRIRFVFILGLSQFQNINVQVLEESILNNDIIQSNMMDTLKNLSYKSITAWKWIGLNCRNAKFILKVDDDTIVNTYLILEYVKFLKSFNNSLKHKYFCEILPKAIVDRNRNGKYRMSCDDYDRTYYDSYCCGIGNIFTSDLVPKLYNATFNAKYFWVDDVYVGFITQSLKVQMHNINDYIAKYNNLNWYVSKPFIFVRDVHNLKDIDAVWRFIYSIYIDKIYKNILNNATQSWKTIVKKYLISETTNS